MHEPVVEAAERDEVAELRLAAVRPVLDMVTVGKASAVATGEAATAVACFEGPAQRGRNAARFAADIERLAAGSFEDTDDSCIVV
jgi:hypothetical protein